MSTHHPDILLLNLPFGPVATPYISIPVLAAYLRQRNISVAAYDIRRELYVRLLTPQNIFKGINQARARFLELNNASELTFSEMLEYHTILVILSEIQAFSKDIEKLLFPFADFSDIQQSKVKNFFIRAATFPFFPEMIFPDFTFSIGSEYNIYSTADILKASEDTSGYTRMFEEIIVEEILPVYSSRIIGISVTFTSQIIPAFQCARILKHHLPDVHITMGGPCISTYFRELQEQRFFDLVDSFVLDEGEIPLEILSQELSGTYPNFNKVPGLMYLADNEIHTNPPAPPLDMEQSPPPDYTVFQLDKYLYTGRRLIVPFRLSRGCSWRKCTFCRTDLHMCRDFQQPPAEFVYEQLVHVVKTAGISAFLFSDESADPEVLEYISKRLIEDQLSIAWFAHTRVSKLLTKDRCQLYRKAGCIGIRLGIESFFDRILKLMRKGITVKLVEEVLKEIDGVLPVSVYMIVGFPTETKEEALQGFEKIHKLMTKGLIQQYYYSMFQILYGSDIWNHPEKYGISEMAVPEGSDLFPDILDFQGSGMSRETAHQLQLQFNKRFHPFTEEMYACEVVIDNEIVSARYDPRKVRHTIEQNSFSILPFIGWLNQLDQTLEPLKPMHP